MSHNLDDMNGYATAPSYIYRSKFTKDEKIIATVLSAFMDCHGMWLYDVSKLAYASGMSENETEKALDLLQKRGVVSFFEGGDISLEWARSPAGWME